MAHLAARTTNTGALVFGTTPEHSQTDSKVSALSLSLLPSRKSFSHSSTSAAHQVDSYAGTELVGLAATEHPNPRKAMPGACKMTFWRISFIYIMSLFFIGLLVP